MRSAPIRRSRAWALAAAAVLVTVAATPDAPGTPVSRPNADPPAVQAAEATATRESRNAVAAYDAGLACSLAGESDRAIDWLLEAARRGYSGIRSLGSDDELDPVRTHPRFAEVTAAVQSNVDRRFAAFRAAAEEHQPTVILPPDHDPSTPAPLLVLLHGTGGTGRGIARAWTDAAAAHGAIIVAPDALRPVRDSAGFSWHFRDESEWLVLRTIEDARRRWAVGPVVLAGFSQGANIALMLGQSHPAQFHAVIPVCGHYEADVADVPAAGRRPRWCLLTGARDPWAPTYAVAERTLAGAGMAVRRHEMPGVGHAMPSGERGAALLRDVLEWALKSEPVAPERPTSPASGAR